MMLQTRKPALLYTFLRRRDTLDSKSRKHVTCQNIVQIAMF